MTLNEVAAILGTTKEVVEQLIQEGTSLPVSKGQAKLPSTSINAIVDISEEGLDAFISQFEKEEPGRHPPTAVRRELLIESRHRCAICRQTGPLEFHHTIEWSKLKHHDPKYMLAVCPTDHALCGNGSIDSKSQSMYKAKLLASSVTIDPYDPYKEKKRADDLKAMTGLFDLFPRSFVNAYLGEARWDRIHYDILDAMVPFCNKLTSSVFYLYDKPLKKLLDDFRLCWVNASELSGSLYHDYNHNGVATLIDGGIEFRYEKYEQFQSLVIQAQRSLSQLVGYLKEQYPDFDHDELDHKACTSYKDLSERVEREAKEHYESILRKLKE